MLTFLTKDTDLLMITLALVIIGIGYALFSSPNTNAIMSAVEPRFYGVASGTVGTMRLLGQVFSMGIATLLFASLARGKLRDWVGMDPKQFSHGSEDESSSMAFTGLRLAMPQ